jgi:hypothetical protein
MSRSLLAVLMTLLASSARAGGRSGGDFYRGGFPGRGFAVFHRHGGRPRFLRRLQLQL